MGTPSLGILPAGDGAGLVAFCTSLRAAPAGAAMLVASQESGIKGDQRLEVVDPTCLIASAT